jgi:hypothetical protein
VIGIICKASMTELQHYALSNATAERNAPEYLARRRSASVIENIVLRVVPFAVVMGIIIAVGAWLSSEWVKPLLCARTDCRLRTLTARKSHASVRRIAALIRHRLGDVGGDPPYLRVTAARVRR